MFKSVCGLRYLEQIKPVGMFALAHQSEREFLPQYDR